LNQPIGFLVKDKSLAVLSKNLPVSVSNILDYCANSWLVNSCGPSIFLPIIPILCLVGLVTV